MKCNISAWCRQTLTDHAKKRIAGFGLLCTLLLAGILSSCTDDEFPEAGMNAMQTISDLRATNPRGLVQQSDGTWMSQKCRVPIVGPGRIVTYIDGESVDGGVAGNNAVDTDLSNYTTTSTKIVNVDVNAYTPIISIRDTHHIYSAGQKVGFIFKETTKGLLTADVLDGITIQTFLDGSDVPQETIVAKGDEESLLNLNLLSITSNGGVISDREISFEATKKFDEVRLCLHGISADVISSSMDISVKYAFVGENREIRATSEDEFKDYWSSGVPTIGKNNIALSDHIVDSYIDNSAPFTSDAWIPSYATVNFHKTIPAGTEIGFRYSNNSFVSISVFGENAPTISTYNDQNEEIESSTPDKDLLGIGLIQNTRDAYISIQTTKPCTQVRFTHPSQFASLGVMNVYYAYVREPVKLDPYRLTLTGGITHLCKGDAALIPVESTTLPGGSVLSLEWKNRDNEKTGTTNCTLSEDGQILQVDDAALWEEGRYYVDILYEGEPLCDNAEVYVHPKQTTWQPQGNSTDWNTWGNWTNGVPWDCSNVFIPANVEKYPVLSASGTEEYWCNNIHFAPGAELIGQSHLHYTQAFVDMNLSSGAYHLISAPLQAMVTGDMFVARNVNDWETWRRETSSDNLLPNYFKPIDGEKQGNDNNSAYIEQRINPYIYQRFWNSAVRNETLTRSYNTTDKAITEFTDWSRSFNAVETNYEVGQGFALKAGNGTNATHYHFHFPKSFSTYHYYGINGNSLKGSSITRTTEQIGRFWTAEQINGLTLKRKTSGTLYLFGNPFMAHINIKKFLDANPSVSSVKVYKGGQYVDITSSNVAGAQIAPMQAVFLTATAAGTQLPIKLSEDMLEQGKSSTRLTRRMANQVRLTATSNRHSASCVVVSSSSGNDKFNSREDVTLLVGSEEGAGVAVYTIADGKALSIQRMRSATRIPVGFYLKRTGNVSLAFDASDNIWSGWRLKDKQTGRSYPLKGRITLHNVSTGSGRFFLEKVK